MCGHYNCSPFAESCITRIRIPACREVAVHDTLIVIAKRGIITWLAPGFVSSSIRRQGSVSRDEIMQRTRIHVAQKSPVYARPDTSSACRAVCGGGIHGAPPHR